MSYASGHFLTRTWPKRAVALLVVSTAAILMFASPSLASHPPIPCTDDNYASGYTSRDGEVWIGGYDVDWDDYFLIPMRPATDPSDAVVYRHQSVTDSQGVLYLVISRLEWIGYN